MNIEIAPQKYWKRLTYFDGLLYCSMLDIDGYTDWRIIKDVSDYKRAQKLLCHIPQVWTLEDINKFNPHFLASSKFWIMPVRDL